MGLDIHFFKKGFDLQKNRAEKVVTYEKLQAIKAKLEELEDDYDSAHLSSFNITHNLNKMANEVELHEVLWSPYKVGITTASQMISLLEKGIKKLEANPDKYKEYNPPNGLGTYEDLVSFCKSVLHNCYENPDATIEVSS